MNFLLLTSMSVIKYEIMSVLNNGVIISFIDRDFWNKDDCNEARILLSKAKELLPCISSALYLKNLNWIGM